MSGPLTSSALLRKLFDRVDPRLRPQLRLEWRRHREEPPPQPPGEQQHIVLAGHRSAGKSSLLPLVAAAFSRPAVDLDHFIATKHQRPLREWVLTDQPGFRVAERAAFAELPAGRVVAVGGGFLSLHADLLALHYTVVVPISFETYRQRLSLDKKRPRLRPELPLEEELRLVYQEREALHAKVPTQPLWRLIQLIDARR